MIRRMFVVAGRATHGAGHTVAILKKATTTGSTLIRPVTRDEWLCGVKVLDVRASKAYYVVVQSTISKGDLSEVVIFQLDRHL